MSSHHEHCSLLCFLHFRKKMLELEKNSKDAQLSDYVSLERDKLGLEFSPKREDA